MTNLLADMVEYASAYLDVIAIFSQSWGQHLVHIRKVMDRLREAGLTLKPQKFAFGMTKCEYLGHMVGGGQVEQDFSTIAYPLTQMTKNKGEAWTTEAEQAFEQLKLALTSGTVLIKST